MNRSRNQRGGITALGAALALALVVMGVGFLFLSMYMGGQNETKNAVDAGSLNTGKQVLDQISVNLSNDPNQQCFLDVTSDGTETTDGKVDLRRINRVWAEAMLIAINAQAASDDGFDHQDYSGSGASNAGYANQGAQSISDALSSKLTTPANLFGFFTDYSKANSVRMIGTGVRTDVLQGSGWQTSLMDRNDESNIVLPGNSSNNYNMPPGFNLDSSYVTGCTRTPIPQGGANLSFLKGYLPLTIGSNTFWQVPFQYDEKPHLVARSTFDANTNAAAPLSWNQAVPNAYSVDGKAVKSGPNGEQAMSWVLTNPRQPFQLSMPHSFVHIHLDNMVSKWYFLNPVTGYPLIEEGAEQDYGFTPESQSSTPGTGPGCSLVTPDDVEMGLEVVGKSLDGVIFDMPCSNGSVMEAYLVNRINEMVSQVGSSLTASDLHSALSNFQTIGWLVAGVQDFYLFSNDGVHLTVQPETTAIAMAPWLAPLINNAPDGTERTISSDDSSSLFPPSFPDVVPLPTFTTVLDLGLGSYHEAEYWTPGTGYNSCLGQLRITRWSEVDSLGAAVFTLF